MTRTEAFELLTANPRASVYYMARDATLQHHCRVHVAVEDGALTRSHPTGDGGRIAAPEGVCFYRDTSEACVVTVDPDDFAPAQAQAVAEALADDPDHGKLVLALCAAHGSVVWMADDGNAKAATEGCTGPEAAREYVDGGDWGDSGGFVEVFAWQRYTLGDAVIDDEGSRDSHIVEIEAVPPPCTEPEHHWCTPHDVLGGDEENPGVRANGGGVLLRDVCRHCGSLRTTDTWASHGAVQGLTRTSYAPPGEHAFSDAFDTWAAEGGTDA